MVSDMTKKSCPYNERYELPDIADIWLVITYSNELRYTVEHVNKNTDAGWVPTAQ